MQLTQQTDYALRTLIYTAMFPNRLVNISEISEYYDISRSHLTKVIAKLTKYQYLEGIRGNQGGLKLGKDASQINIGALIRDFEDFPIVECFSCHNNCKITQNCRLQSIIADALNSFIKVLDGYYLSDVVGNPSLLKMIQQQTKQVDSTPSQSLLYKG